MKNSIQIGNLLILWAGTFEQIRKDIKIAREKEKRKKVGFMGLDDDLNRKVLEKEKVELFMPLLLERKDFMKQRNSGLNQVLAKIAKKKEVSIGINFDEIINSYGKRKSQILARIKQNIKLCNKNKLKMKFIFLDKKNNRNIHDLKSLGLVLGMPTSMTKLLDSDKF